MGTAGSVDLSKISAGAWRPGEPIEEIFQGMTLPARKTVGGLHRRPAQHNLELRRHNPA
jgi:hypothetical protein